MSDRLKRILVMHTLKPTVPVYGAFRRDVGEGAYIGRFFDNEDDARAWAKNEDKQCFVASVRYLTPPEQQEESGATP